MACAFLLPEWVEALPAAAAGSAERMDAAGFGRVRYFVLAGGIITIHAGAVSA